MPGPGPGGVVMEAPQPRGVTKTDIPPTEERGVRGVEHPLEGTGGGGTKKGELPGALPGKIGRAHV